MVVDEQVSHLILPCGTVGLISTSDAPLVSELACSLADDGYVLGGSGLARGTRRLHRVLLGAPKGTEVDHRNGVRHDNRRENLRIATELINSRNRHWTRASSGVKGVQRRVRASGPRYFAFIHINGKKRGLGTFDRLEDAVTARRSGEAELWGDAR